MLYETFLVGVVLAVLFTELTDLYPGGIIVPAYFALYLNEPLRLLGTVLIAGLSLMLYRFLSRYFILFGKRRFVIFILLGALLSQIWILVLPQLLPSLSGFPILGWVIPGLLANNLEKQRLLPTLASLFTVAVLTYSLVRVLNYFFLGGV
ncbi:MAG: poly-gamma-glutamate biosynthesis protein PgsC, partial [Candidatus Aminicenantes bacterium]|nr:poly-gamma-glutamate biosynthesis protein PgsC [Candidatus Aminicenantes bacterium]